MPPDLFNGTKQPMFTTPLSQSPDPISLSYSSFFPPQEPTRQKPRQRGLVSRVWKGIFGGREDIDKLLQALSKEEDALRSRVHCRARASCQNANDVLALASALEGRTLTDSDSAPSLHNRQVRTPEAAGYSGDLLPRAPYAAADRRSASAHSSRSPATLRRSGNGMLSFVTEVGG